MKIFKQWDNNFIKEFIQITMKNTKAIIGKWEIYYL